MGTYQGVILAGGHGSRMGALGQMLPKPIMPICNKPLLAYQLESMRAIGIDDVIVVIGHLGYRITQILGDGSRFGVRIRYVEQGKRLGIAHAVGQLEPFVDRPFMLFLGDIYFEISDLNLMIDGMENQGASAVLAVKEETDPEAVKRNFAVILRDDGTVRRVVEKPRHLPNMLKGCGLYLFDLPIFDAIRRTPRTAMRDEYELTDSIQILVDYDYPVRVAPVVEWDMNVTYVGDLVRCSMRVLDRLGTHSLMGDRCKLAAGVELVNSVLGDDVIVAGPARLERCVVMPGVSLPGGEDYTDCVITKEGVLKSYLEV